MMRRRRVLAALAGLLVAGWPAVIGAMPADADARSRLAPTGMLRAAINYGNSALAHRDASGTLSGISVDIARELGRRLGVPVSLVPFDAAGRVTAAAGANVWDVAFLAVDPKRAQAISFSQPYAAIDGSYVVRKGSAITAVEQVDRPGVTVAVSRGSAYDLFLTRTLRHARIVRGTDPAEAKALFQARHLDVLAGVKSAVARIVADNPDLRLIPEPFMKINQAIATPAGRPGTARNLSAFVDELEANGFLAGSFERNHQTGIALARQR